MVFFSIIQLEPIQFYCGTQSVIIENKKIRRLFFCWSIRSNLILRGIQRQINEKKTKMFFLIVKKTNKFFWFFLVSAD